MAFVPDSSGHVLSLGYLDPRKWGVTLARILPNIYVYIHVCIHTCVYCYLPLPPWFGHMELGDCPHRACFQEVELQGAGLPGNGISKARPSFEGYGMRSKSLTACVHIPWSMHSECKGQDFSTSRTRSLEKGMETYPQGLVCRA